MGLKQLNGLTVNQLILLLDIYRGYEAIRHPGTLRTDLRMLKRANLITDDIVEPRLTLTGEAMIVRIQNLFN